MNHLAITNETKDAVKEEQQALILAQEILRITEARFRAVQKSVLDGIISMDEDGRITECNPAAEKMFGFSQSEILGKPMMETLFPSSLRGEQNTILGKRLEMSALKSGGRKFPVEIAIVKISIKGPPMFTAFVQDITERKRAEMETLRNIVALQRVNQELKQFVYVASHDLQEPLRMIASFTQLLARRYSGKLDAEADKFIAYVVDGAKRMQDLIKSLVEYSQSGREDIPQETVDSLESLKATVNNLSKLVAESRATITWDPLPSVNSDKVQLSQLFQNLIGNAIKFHGNTPPKIHVSAERNSEGWLFSIQDNGIGMTVEDTQRIFVIFKRLHDQSEYPGTGVGLAICKKIVERHGGRIWVKSQPGAGSTFYFTIPQS